MQQSDLGGDPERRWLARLVMGAPDEFALGLGEDQGNAQLFETRKFVLVLAHQLPDAQKRRFIADGYLEKPQLLVFVGPHAEELDLVGVTGGVGRNRRGLGRWASAGAVC